MPLCQGPIIELEHLPKELVKDKPKKTGEIPSDHLRSAEKEIIVEALRRNDGHRARTARELGIDFKHLMAKDEKIWDKYLNRINSIFATA